MPPRRQPIVDHAMEMNVMQQHNETLTRDVEVMCVHQNNILEALANHPPRTYAAAAGNDFRPPIGCGGLGRAAFDPAASHMGFIDEDTLSMHNPFAPPDFADRGGLDPSRWELGIRVDIP
ncbi:hypothetical protein ACS0TY_016283 [Phlomoides rotata]